MSKPKRGHYGNLPTDPPRNWSHTLGTTALMFFVCTYRLNGAFYERVIVMFPVRGPTKNSEMCMKFALIRFPVYTVICVDVQFLDAI
jgi:hypothetical protein